VLDLATSLTGFSPSAAFEMGLANADTAQRHRTSLRKRIEISRHQEGAEEQVGRTAGTPARAVGGLRPHICWILPKSVQADVVREGSYMDLLDCLVPLMPSDKISVEELFSAHDSMTTDPRPSSETK
jgi:hypothetical protein